MTIIVKTLWPLKSSKVLLHGIEGSADMIYAKATVSPFSDNLYRCDHFTTYSSGARSPNSSGSRVSNKFQALTPSVMKSSFHSFSFQY
jgi:hypothetical protein